MVRPVIGHRGKEMQELLSGMDPALRGLFCTDRPVYVSTSSATGFMEAAITNLSRRRILCLVGGAFGQRFHKIATRCGRPADTLAVEWGSPHLPQLLRDRLDAEPGAYDLVTVVHSETLTGVLNPVRELAAVVREHDDLLIAVDGVTLVGGAPSRVRRMGASTSCSPGPRRRWPCLRGWRSRRPPRGRCAGRSRFPPGVTTSTCWSSSVGHPTSRRRILRQ